MTAERAYAKINLCLDITGRMENGYHSIKSVMQSVEFCDEVTLTERSGDSISAQCSMDYIPSGDKNIAVRAVSVFRAQTGAGPRGALVSIDKKIPVCSGLGGGSTDAAAVLRLLNRVYGTGLPAERLREIGASLGSDVPFCVTGGTKLAEGRGEILTDIVPMPRCYIVISKPDFSLSTPELFGAMDKLKIKARPDTAGLISAVKDGDLIEIGRRLFNVFENALTKNQNATVSYIKGRLLDLGALGASMSGSGSAVFGIFGAESEAQNAARELNAEGMDSYLTCPLPELEIM